MYNAEALMSYCEAFFIKNFQSLITGNDTFRKLLFNSRHAYLAHGILVTLGNKMEEMLRRRCNTPKTPVISPAQMLNPGNAARSPVDGSVNPLFPGSVHRNLSETLEGSRMCNGNLPRAPGTPPRHMLFPGQLPKKPDIPPPAIPHSAQNSPAVVPPPR